MAFVLVEDRRKTGAQILRKYDKSRFPGVFPKDLLQVSRTAEGLQVNGRKYELVREEQGGEGLPDRRVAAPALSLEAVRRLEAEQKEAAARLEEWQQREEGFAKGHLFLDDALRDVLKNAFKRVRADMTSLQIESQELGHAAGLR